MDKHGWPSRRNQPLTAGDVHTARECFLCSVGNSPKPSRHNGLRRGGVSLFTAEQASFILLLWRGTSCLLWVCPAGHWRRRWSQRGNGHTETTSRVRVPHSSLLLHLLTRRTAVQGPRSHGSRQSVQFRPAALYSTTFTTIKGRIQNGTRRLYQGKSKRDQKGSRRDVRSSFQTKAKGILRTPQRHSAIPGGLSTQLPGQSLSVLDAGIQPSWWRHDASVTAGEPGEQHRSCPARQNLCPARPLPSRRSRDARAASLRSSEPFEPLLVLAVMGTAAIFYQEACHAVD